MKIERLTYEKNSIVCVSIIMFCAVGIPHRNYVDHNKRDNNEKRQERLVAIEH